MAEFLSIFYLWVAIIAALWLGWGWWKDRPYIPQAEIDSEVRQIMIEHGTGPEAVAYAEGIVQRMQWHKDGRKILKADRVLAAVKKKII